MERLFLWMDNAITLKPISDKVFDYGKSKFEIANQTISDEGLRNAGVSDPQLIKSLGIFGLFLLCLLISLSIYLLLRFLEKKFEFMRIPKEFIYKKLFYNSYLRYMIVSNLKLTMLLWAFFFYSYGIDSSKSRLYTIGYLLGIISLLAYSFGLMYFLLKY